MSDRAEALFGRGAALAGARDYIAAQGCLEEALAEDESHAASWNLLASLHLQFARVPEAMKAALRAVELAPGTPAFHYTLGRTCKAAGEYERAIQHYRQAAKLDPANASIQCSVGVTLCILKRFDEAIECYRAALAIDPNHLEARHNLARVLNLVGQSVAAASLLADAPGATVAEEFRRIAKEAEAFEERGEHAAALSRWTDALRLAPNLALVHYKIGVALAALEEWDDALRRFETAVSLQANFPEAVEAGRRISIAMGLADEAATYSARARSLNSSDVTLVLEKLLLPAIQASAASIDESRRAYSAGLDELRQIRQAPDRPDRAFGVLNFFLAYHGMNDRELQQKLAQTVLHLYPGLAWRAPHCEAPERPAGRARVGFISDLLRNHSIGKTSRGLIAEIPRERYEVFAINPPGSARTLDATASWIRNHSDHWLQLEGDLERVRAEIADLKLDILFYQDIGMTPFSYYLAFSRLAPVQCVSFGHPDTTGAPGIDYFVSNDLFEPDGASAHYTEELFLLKDLPTLAYYYRPPQGPGTLSRGEFGLSENEHVYLCAQTLFKMHPDFDSILADILRRDPRGRIVLLQGNMRQWTVQLQGRFQRTMPDVAQRIVFLPHQKGQHFMRLLELADVALDTPHFNGMNSSLEAFAVGTPIVTLPTGLQRGRHTQAMYRKMQLTDCVAGDATEYADIAVRIGTDADYRQALRASILERNPVLYEDRRVVTEFDRFFQSVLLEKTS